MEKDIFMLDVPETENDAIGYDIYVDSIINAIDSKAKMIGLVSNYGSGKSTVLKMVENKFAQKELKEKNQKKKTKILNINLWKIKEKNSSSKLNPKDETIEIHKFFLNRLIENLPKNSNKKYYQKKIDNKYSLFNITTRNKGDIYCLYGIIVLFVFNLIAKMKLLNFTIDNEWLFLVDFIIAVLTVIFIYNTEIYLSFKKDNTERKIDENDTVECYKVIMEEYMSYKSINKLIICIEDLDRYNDSEFVIKVLEQIYKLYKESSIENVIFIISLKSPYKLKEDSKQDISNPQEKVDSNEVNTIKGLYEKIFDIIINLQTVSFQDYGSVLISLIKTKEAVLTELEIPVPKTEEEIGAWRYLYSGKNVSIRDIKHRFNYFLVLYSNLYNHKKTLEKPELIKIELETCLFVSYLEDEYSSEFYELLEDKEKFRKIVSDFLIKKKINLDKTSEFEKEIEEGLTKGLIKADYTMYFYKYPKNKPINNIYDTTIQNAIFTDKYFDEENFNEYCNNASEELIIKTIKEKYNANQFPEIVLRNKRLYGIAKKVNFENIIKFLKDNCLFSSRTGSRKVQEILKAINVLEEELFRIYINILREDLYGNFSDEEIVKYRLDIIKNIGFSDKIMELYDEYMPLVSLKELRYAPSAEIALSILKSNVISDESIELIDYIVSMFDIKFNVLMEFLDEIKEIDEELFKKVFYRFDYTKYTKNQRSSIYKKGYKSLNLKELEDLMVFVQKIKVLPLKKEKEIVEYLKQLPEDKCEIEEKKYIDIINSIGKISSITKKNIPELLYYHIYSEEVEEQLYNSGLYNEFCYSRFNRLNSMNFEVEKFEELKPYYITFFKEYDTFEKDKYDQRVLRHIKQNVSYDELTFDKIKILNTLPQTKDDFEFIRQGKYEGANGTPNYDEIKIYLRSLTGIVPENETEFTNNIVDLVKKEDFPLSKESFKHIKSILTKNNKLRFNKIEDLCR